MRFRDSDRILITKAFNPTTRYAALLILCAVYCTGNIVSAQPGPDKKPSPSFDRKIEKRIRIDAHDPGRERRHYNPEDFRQDMKAELERIPSLKKRMDRLMDIQSERYKLQSQRRSVTSEQTTDRGAVVRKFHELLRRDMELSEESRKIVQEIVRDMPNIQSEIKARKKTLQDQLNSADSDTTSSVARDVRRSQRYLDFLEKKLKDLKSHPDRLDLLSRMLRGIPFDDGPLANDITSADLTPEQRMDELRMKRRHLQWQLRQVEKDIDQLKAKGIPDKDDDKDRP